MRRNRTSTVAPLIAGLVLFCAASARAQAAASVPEPGPVVVVRTELGAPTVHHGFASARLRTVGGRKLDGRTRLVLAVVTQLEGTFVNGPRGDKGFWVSAIRVTLGYRDADIHVAADYAEGSDNYQSILDHEGAHVRADRAVVEEYAEKIRAALLAAPLPTYANPLEVGSLAEGMKQVKAEVSEIVDALLGELKSKRREATKALDGGDRRRSALD